MKIYPLICAALLCLAACGRAQNANRAADNSIYQLDDVARATPGNLARFRGVEVAVARDELQDNGFATNSLRDYVRRGGVVFLHTDAATLFGFVTIPAADVVEQSENWAVAILPPLSHPLLGSEGPCDFTLGLPSVRRIAFKVADDDALVLSHPWGQALMQVSGVQAPDGHAVYAAAVAPYGRGWAVFAPSEISPRVDGALFQRDLSKFARGTQNGYVPLSTASILAASNQNDTRPLLAELGVSLTSPTTTEPATPWKLAPINGALPAFGGEKTATEPENLAPDEVPANQGAVPEILDAPVETPEVVAPQANEADEPKLAPIVAAENKDRKDRAALPLAPNEAEKLVADIKSGGRRGRAAVAVLRARVELLAGNFSEAEGWLEQAQVDAPTEAGPNIWQGILAAQGAADVTVSNPVRAVALQRAASLWQSAAGKIAKATALVVPTDPPAIAPKVPIEIFESGISQKTLGEWQSGARASASLMQFTPPSSVVLSGQGGVLNFSSDPDDRNAPYLEMTLRLLLDRLPIQERISVLLFPNDKTLAGYAGQTRLAQKPEIESLNQWYLTQHLGIRPLNKDDPADLLRFQNEFGSRTRAPDMAFNRILFQAFEQAQTHILVRVGGTTQTAFQVFGPSFFEAQRAAFLQIHKN